jgi:hypothetical protein
MSSRERGRRSSSLNEGTMMESLNADAALAGAARVIVSSPARGHGVLFPGARVQNFLDLREREIALLIPIVKVR